ncbi:hypothetical protein GALMADRAFT_257648 [Galerina marginata CBS 339.88]|uniref:Extracellular membrane protein CFEM domain-containing protein n=1 Tax=Galerina marginata (strain CBS 339.88) TaxID=685588 RepID=A0A067SA76_GALM3|nr:hypothetical protein GALMADRAFT_257648 [Galerina marginata CBS 339.88]
MFSDLSRRRLSIFLLFLTACTQSVFGQDQLVRYDILQGQDGKSSCDLKDTIHSSCNSTPSPPLNVTPTASLCTCNNKFFNIWSACSYASGNGTLPNFGTWSATCQNHSVDLAGSATRADQGFGIPLPAWASLPVPGNTSFDLQRAVVEAQKQTPKPWSILQIVLPIVAAIIAVVLTLLGVRFYRRQLPTVRFGVENLVRRRNKVRNVDQKSLDHWEIDGPDVDPPKESRLQDSPPLQEQYPEVEDVVSPTDTTPGTVPARPSGSFDESIGRRSQSTGPMYPFSPKAAAQLQAQQAQFLAPLRGTANFDPNPSASSSNRTIWSLPRSVHLPNPFKRRIPRVISRSPYPGYRVDQSTESADSRRYTDSTDTRTRTSRVGTRRSNAFDESSHDEHVDLISPEERASSLFQGTEEVVFGSRSGHSSTINSHIRVVSPSVSTESPRSTMLHTGSRNSGVPPQRPTVIVPPLPSRPAPLPPVPPPRISPRGKEIMSNPLVPPHHVTVADRFMSPIPEDRFSDINISVYPGENASMDDISMSLYERSIRPTPSRSFSESSSEHPRPLPSPASSSSAAQAHYFATHQRSASHPPPLPGSSNLNGSATSLHAAGAHIRSASQDQYSPAHYPLRTRTPLAESSRPLPPPGVSPPSRLPPTYFREPQRKGSNNSVSSSSMYSPQDQDMFDPYAFSSSHRGLSTDDNASFYLTADTLHGPARSGTPSSQRSDPSVYYPGPVRGAGYGG